MTWMRQQQRPPSNTILPSRLTLISTFFPPAHQPTAWGRVRNLAWGNWEGELERLDPMTFLRAWHGPRNRNEQPPDHPVIHDGQTHQTT
jgi:hypothetical protein